MTRQKGKMPDLYYVGSTLSGRLCQVLFVVFIIFVVVCLLNHVCFKSC